jgi:hypothetical protein
MIRTIYLTVITGMALSSCESEPKLALSPATMDCVQGSCIVTFDVTNASDDTLPLIYEVSLSQNHVRGPGKSGLVVVGTANGAIDLPPKETKTVEIEIEVTETPNGSKVSVAGSRTPELILGIHQRLAGM